MDRYDFESDRSPKRRRVNGATSRHESRYSSPDELAVDSDHEDIYVKRQSITARRDSGDVRRKSYTDSAGEESPDELDHTVHTFYRGGRGRGHTTSSTPSSLGQVNQTTRLRASPPRTKPYAPYKQKAVLKGHKKGVAAVKFSPDGEKIASCSADATIRIWDLFTGGQVHVLEGHLAGVSTIAWSPDSKTLASGSDDKSIRLWDVSSGRAYPNHLLGHHNYIYSLAFSPKGNMLVSGSYDEAVFLWNVRTSRKMRDLPAHSDPVGGVDFIRDGTMIVSCGGDGLIRIWDTPTGQCLRTLVHEDNAAVTSVKFSPNGKFVLAWTLDSSVRLWNYVEGRCVKTYQGHVNKKYSLTGAFGVYGKPEQAFAVSGSEDGAIIVWDVVSKEILQRLEGHEDTVLGVDTLIGQGKMVSCGLDRTIRVWEASEEEMEIAEDEEMT
ncbi:MAG: WD domain protein [Icmadophila ericetorum]|nr:WD domain protein [Icmadophila ericetorum]